MAADFLTTSTALAHQNRTGSPISPTKDVTDDTLRPPHLVSDSDFEAQPDYYGFPSNGSLPYGGRVEEAYRPRGAACAEGG